MLGKDILKAGLPLQDRFLYQAFITVWDIRPGVRIWEASHSQALLHGCDQRHDLLGKHPFIFLLWKQGAVGVQFSQGFPAQLRDLTELLALSVEPSVHGGEAEGSFNETVQLLLAGDGTLLLLGEEPDLEGFFGFGQVELSLFRGTVLGVTVGQQTHPTDVLGGDQRGMKESKPCFFPLHNLKQRLAPIACCYVSWRK